MPQASAASGAPPAEPLLTDWTLRPFARAQRSPLLVGLGYALVMIAVSWIFRLAVGEWGRGFAGGPYFWMDILNGVVFAYVPTAGWLLRRGRLRDLHELRPLLRCDDAGWAQLAQRTVSVPPRRLLVSALVGGAFMAAMPIFDPGFWEATRPPLTDPLLILLTLRNFAMGVLLGHVLVTELTGVAAFARGGLRSAFAWVLASSLVSLFWLGPAAGNANTGIVFGSLAFVTVGFFFTIYGVHQSIREAKRAALDGLTEDIRRAGSALESGAPRDDAPALADLVAYQGFLERVPEWPLSAPSLVRGALIAALGVGSWLGGALVERLIDYLC